MPGVLAASASRSTSGASGMPRVCTSRISARPARSGGLHGDAAVEAARAQQRRVEHVGAVGRGEHDDRLGRLEAVHLGEDLVERLLALVVGAGDGDRPLARAADRVELVDEDDRRLRGLALANRSRTREAPTPTIASMNSDAEIEKNAAWASPATARASSVLPVPGRAREQHAVGHAPAEAPVALGVLEEVDDLRQLGLGLVDAGDVGEGDADRLRVDAARLRAAEVAERAHAAAGRGGAPREQHEQADDQQRRAEAEQDLGQQRGARWSSTSR